MIIRFTLTLFLVLSFGLNAHAQTGGQTFYLNGFEFDRIESALDSVGIKPHTVKIKKGDHTLKEFILYSEIGDCSSTELKVGDYDIHDDQLIFYSYWASADRMPGTLLPYGFKKAVYTADNDGTLVLKSAVIYKEDYVISEGNKYLEDHGWKHKGIDLLALSTPSKAETEIIDHYIKNIEKQEEAVFIRGKDRENLESLVRQKLADKIKSATAGWENAEVYGRVKK